MAAAGVIGSLGIAEARERVIIVQRRIAESGVVGLGLSFNFLGIITFARLLGSKRIEPDVIVRFW